LYARYPKVWVYNKSEFYLKPYIEISKEVERTIVKNMIKNAWPTSGWICNYEVRYTLSILIKVVLN
jgi:hypothetical protein